MTCVFAERVGRPSHDVSRPAAGAARRPDAGRSPDSPWDRLATRNPRANPAFQGGPATGAPQSTPAIGRPPLLDRLDVAVPGPVTAQATSAIKPHLHLGVPVMGPSGVVFTGRTTGGPGAGGEMFFSQVIRHSVREIRIGRGLTTDTVKDELDAGPIYKGTTSAVGAGHNVISETDTPGETQSATAFDTRFTFHIHDQFELFLMWRPGPASPTSDWLTYGSVDWSWEATATGVTSDSKVLWLAPTEPFHACPHARLASGSLSLTKGTPKPATHLGLPVHQSGRAAPAVATPAFSTDADKGPLEKNCP